MTIDEAIIHAEEKAEEQEKSAEMWGLYPQSKYDSHLCKKAYNNCKQCASEHRQLAEWLKELKTLRGKQEMRANKESARYVFDELLKCDLFRGKYDAKNGKVGFMQGVFTVMESIAYMVSEDCHDKFDKEFTSNMIESEDKARNRISYLNATFDAERRNT